MLGICLAAAGCGESGSDTPTPPKRAGCDQYCRQSGGFGAPAASPPPLAVVAGPRDVKVTDGSIPVTVRCRFDRQCTGAILITLDQTELGRSDLRVPAKSTKAIGVPLSPAGGKVLSGGRRVRALVTLDVGVTWNSLPPGSRNAWAAVQPGFITVAR